VSENPTLHQRLAPGIPGGQRTDHPNIVRALALETDGGDELPRVRKLIDGGSGRPHREARPAARDVAIRIITQIAQALQYATNGKSSIAM